MGENPEVAEVSGISVYKTRYLCVILGGMLMGFAGAIYSLDYNPVWSYNFLMGWGFIAWLWYFSPCGIRLSCLLARCFLDFVAAFPQPSACAPGCYVQVYLEDSSLCHYSGCFGAHVNKMVQDSLGRSPSRGAWTTFYK